MICFKLLVKLYSLLSDHKKCYMFHLFLVMLLYFL